MLISRDCLTYRAYGGRKISWQTQINTQVAGMFSPGVVFAVLAKMTTGKLVIHRPVASNTTEFANAQLSNVRTMKPKRPDWPSTGDGLPVLMMADQEGR